MRRQLHELVADLLAQFDEPYHSWEQALNDADAVLELVREHLVERAQFTRDAHYWEPLKPDAVCPVCDVVAWLGQEVR